MSRLRSRVEPIPLTPEERRALERRRKAILRSRSDTDYLESAKRVGPGHPFMEGCRLAAVSPTEREVKKWRAGTGRALVAAWRKHPRSKTLPRLKSLSICVHCGEPGQHFAPPSFGEPGFFICEASV